MNIKFTGIFKSITSFEWNDIPNFVVITGPNGTGKSQLLELVYNTVVDKFGTSERVTIVGDVIKPNEVTFLKGEWQLQNTNSVDLSTIQQYFTDQFQKFRQATEGQRVNEQNIRRIDTFKDIQKKTGKASKTQITKEEFILHFPEFFIEQESQLSQKIGEVFYNYRLSEIDLQSKGKTPEEIKLELGEKPWHVLREIIRESKLPFEINDPTSNGVRDGFKLKLHHIILNVEVNFNDLSSGEKVLISLMFYLYNSQEKSIFPKLLLLDEPDAHLHPSMSQQFLNVIKNVLVDKFGVKVIMTTHSPSTVILSPNDCIYEMSREGIRIQKAISKNHAVSLLTAGLVYVGEGTKYFLVEDEDDVKFYSYVYNQLVTVGKINADIPLVFIPASTKDKSGGKDVVQNWVNKLQDSGIANIISGLIDADSGNEDGNGIYKINRYSIENYLVDPIVVYAALVDRERNPVVDGVEILVGEEYKLKLLDEVDLQKIADKIFELVKPEIETCFPDLQESGENEIIEVVFENFKLQYPKWVITKRGKTILNEAYNKTFGSPIINFKTLLKALKKLNLFPLDLVTKIEELKNGG